MTVGRTVSLMSSNLFFDSAADAARAAGVSDTTIIEQCKTGAIPGAYQSSDNWWRVPVDGMREAGYQVTGEGAHAVGPYDRKLPEPIINADDGNPEWHADEYTVDVDRGMVGLWTPDGAAWGQTPNQARNLALALLAAANHAEGVGRAGGNHE